MSNCFWNTPTPSLSLSLLSLSLSLPPSLPPSLSLSPSLPLSLPPSLSLPPPLSLSLSLSPPLSLSPSLPPPLSNNNKLYLDTVGLTERTGLHKIYMHNLFKLWSIYTIKNRNYSYGNDYAKYYYFLQAMKETGR